MKSITSKILLATVVSLYTLMGWGQVTPPQAPGFVQFPIQTLKQQFEECVSSTHNEEQCRVKFYGDGSGDTCGSLNKELKTAKSKAKTACQQSKSGEDFKSCTDSAKECAEADEDEADDSADVNKGMNQMIQAMTGGTSSTVFGDTKLTASQYKGKCLSRKDFNDEKKSLQQELKDAKENITRLTKKITDTKKDSTDKVRKLTDEFQKLKSDADKEALDQDKENKKSQEQQAQDAIRAQQDLANLRSNVLKAQGQLAQAIGERTRTLAKLADAMIQKNCMEALEKVRSGLKSLAVGSANSLIQQNGEIRKRQQLDYNACIADMRTLREETRTSSQAQIDAAQNDVNGNQAQISKMQDSINLHNSNMASLQAQQAQQAQKDAQSTQSKAMNIYNELTQANQTAQTESAQYQKELNEAEQEKNTASNKLSVLGGKSAGDKSPDEALAAMHEYEAALDSCTSHSPPCPATSCDGKTAGDVKKTGDGSAGSGKKSGTDSKKSTDDN